MPTHTAQTASEPPRKRQKTDAQDAVPLFTSAQAIRNALRAFDPEAVTRTLTALRNQLTIKPSEGKISTQDARLVLVDEFLQLSPGAQDVLQLWETSNPRQPQLPALCCSVLACMLTLLSTHLPYHAAGMQIIKGLLQDQWSRRLFLALSGSSNDLILATLKLFNASANFASGKERKAVLELLPWEGKVLPKLLSMRRRTKSGEDVVDALVRPDIRTLTLLLFLSPLTFSSPYKPVFLEQHIPAIALALKGLPQDPPSVVKHVLEVLWEGLWCDPKVKRTLKVALFGEATMGHLLKLYDNPSDETRDVLHHFLLAICTRPGTGVCFRDRGWYPREDHAYDAVANASQTQSTSAASKIHNRILANLLKHLKPNEDPRQHELTLRILTACPELVTGYWGSAGLTLEPRLSSRWLVNIALAGDIVALPVPTACFYLNNDPSLPNPTPPPLNAILAATLPGGPAMKTHWIKGLQHPKPLVQHASALSLARSLSKYATVLSAFDEVEGGDSFSGSEEGAWATRRAELEREVRRRVPEFGVVVGLSRVADDAQKNDAQRALIGEAAARLMWLYHHVLAGAVREVRVDVGRALVGMETTAVDSADDVAARLRGVQQLHVLRLLRETEDFAWWSKPAGSPHTYLHLFLKGTKTATLLATRTALHNLTAHLLARSVLFQDTPHEPALWLACLPVHPGELDTIVAFLDDCVQRCLKTPYRYMDDLRALAPPDTVDELPSPLLATLLEQARHKPPTVALAVFVKRLLLRLSTMALRAPDVLRVVQGKLDEIWSADRLPKKDQGAIRREIDSMRVCLMRNWSYGHGEDEEMDDEVDSDERVAALASAMDEAGEGISSAMAITAIELVRSESLRVSIEDFRRIATGIARAHCLPDLAEALPPHSRLLRDGLTEELRESLSFEWFLMQTNLSHLQGADYRQTLVSTLGPSPSAFDLRRAFTLIMQHLENDQGRADLHSPLLHSMADLAKRHLRMQPKHEATEMAVYILRVPSVIKVLTSATINAQTREAVARLIEALLPSKEEQAIVSDITVFWSSALTDALKRQNLTVDLIDCASPWLPYLPSSTLVHMFGLAISKLDELAQNTASSLVARLLNVLAQVPDASSSSEFIAARSSELLSLRSTFADRALLDRLLARSITRGIPLGVDGTVPQHPNLPALVQEAEQRWRARHATLPELSAHTFLTADVWDDSSAQIVSGMIYNGQLPESVFAQWIQSDKPSSRSVEHLAIVLGAFADSRGTQLRALWDSITPHATRLYKTVLKPGCPSDSRRTVSIGLQRVLGTLSSLSATFIKSAVNAVQKPTATVTADFLRIMKGVGCSDADELFAAIVERSVRDLVGLLADELGEGAEIHALTNALCHVIVRHPSVVKSHSVETFLAATLQHALALPHVLELAVTLVRKTALKPFVVNRNIQAIVQNPKFQRAAGASSPSREPLVHLLYALFQLHPTNTCQISHVEPLLPIYGGTLSTSDRRILAIFQLFEAERSTPITSLVSRWSSTGHTASQSALDAVQSLDPILVLRTCLNFPKWRSLDALVERRAEAWEQPLYDPVFVALLFAQMILECPPTSALAWVDMLRTNVVSLLIRMISSPNGELRELAVTQLASLWLCLEGADMQEKDHALYVLSLLKDTLSSPNENDDAPRRLPSYTTLVLAHAMRAIFYPTNFIYPLTARFLLQRPLLDIDDVPMLYGMLYSSGDDWKKERGWIIKFLADGMCSTDDWHVFKRRHTWDLLASMFQSAGKDRALRLGVLEVLTNLTCVTRATTSLIIQSGLLSWMEMQLRDIRDDEAVAWVCILENCMALANASRVEAATHGEWRNIICRCLSSIVGNGSVAHQALPWVCRATLRLACLPGSPTNGLSSLIRLALCELQRLETRTNMVTAQEETIFHLHQPPHRAASLHEEHATETLATWGCAVKNLWAAAMRISDERDWGALTSRLVLWRALALDAVDVEADWAREESVRSMSMQAS